MSKLATPHEFQRDLSRLRRLLSDLSKLYEDAYVASLSPAGLGIPTIPQRGTVSDSTGAIVTDPRKEAVRAAIKEAYSTIGVTHQRLLRCRNIAEYGMGMRQRGWDVAETEAAERRAARRAAAR